MLTLVFCSASFTTIAEGLADPSASPSAIVVKLAEQNTKVSMTLVSNVKARVYGGHGHKRGRPPKNSGEPSLESLLAAKKFADHMGSMAAAKDAIEALATLSSTVRGM